MLRFLYHFCSGRGSPNEGSVKKDRPLGICRNISFWASLECLGQPRTLDLITKTDSVFCYVCVRNRGIVAECFHFWTTVIEPRRNQTGFSIISWFMIHPHKYIINHLIWSLIINFRKKNLGPESRVPAQV